jgi:SHS2 domain-containing protein
MGMFDIGDQPKTKNGWQLVLEDLEKIQFPDSVRSQVKTFLIADIHLRNNGELEPNALESAYKGSLDVLVNVRQLIEERSGQRVLTHEIESILRALIEVYNAALNTSLQLRYFVKLEKEKNESTTDASNAGGSQESRQHQSNIIVP